MRPYGFELDRVTIRESEAEVLRAAAQRLLEGESLKSVVNDLNGSGQRTPGGNEWKPNVLKRILISDRVAGRRMTHEGKTRKADWAPILDDLTRKRLVTLLTDKKRDNTKGPISQPVYLLGGGLARCALCGTALVPRPNEGRRGYVCPPSGCGRIRITADPFEKDVAERVLARLLRPQARDELSAAIAAARASASEAEQTIKDAQVKLEQVGRDFAEGMITRPAFHAASDRLKQRISEARSTKRLGEILSGVQTVEAIDMVEWWESSSVEQQRALLRLLVKKVEVSPATVRGSKLYDSNRVKVIWARPNTA